MTSELPIAIITIVIYISNRFLNVFDLIVPWEFAHYHLGDLCGGVLFPAYVNMLSRVFIHKYLINGWVSSLIMSIVCCLCWEVLTPIITQNSTADPIDAIMYILGGVIYMIYHSYVQE